ncbi:MAG: restriction endonuclease [Alphaproteobacteria bacterium]|nr:restriction endonuclease [Alphaproteobacteria bacterium]
MSLLPHDFEDLVREATQLFWRTKSGSSTDSQGGTRSSVLTGKHMDGFMQLAERVALHAGLPASGIHVRGRHLNLPGYFRASKNWDAVFVHEDRLLAALEFKSQVGSFGNNQNNRVEEVVGLGADFWTATRHGLLDSVGRADDRDPRPPYLGYLMLLEKTPRSTEAEVRVKSGRFGFDETFAGATYAERYRLMAERLMSERLFTSVGIVLSEQDEALVDGTYWTMSPATSIKSMFAGFAGHVQVALED